MADQTIVDEQYDNHGSVVLTGSSNAYVATVARAVNAYYQGLRICAKANHTNTGAATLNLVTVNAPAGIGAVAIRKAGNAALAGGEIVSGKYYDFIYDPTNSVFQVSGPDLASGLIRERLTGNRTYFVRTDGSDTNTGLANTSGGAFLTIQKAFDTIADTLDLAGFTPTVQIGDGTYTAGLNADTPLVGGALVNVRGNTGTPANVIISTTNNNCVTNSIGNLSVNIGGFELRTTTSGNCLRAFNGGIITIGASCRFGACAESHFFFSDGGLISVSADYSIVGGAVVHWNGFASSQLLCIGRTITLSGTPAFAFAFASSTQSGLYVFTNTFSGAATGTRYSVTLNGVIHTNGGGATYLPGNASGASATGGQYV